MPFLSHLLTTPLAQRQILQIKIKYKLALLKQITLAKKQKKNIGSVMMSNTTVYKFTIKQ